MESLLSRLLTTELFSMALVFVRLGSAFMVIPGIGDSIVPARVRLLFALALTVIAAPVLSPSLPRLPTSIIQLVLLLASEVAIGFFLGILMRIALSVLDIAGTIIGFSNGLASATVFNPMIQEQGSVIGLLMTTMGIVLMFQTGLYAQMIRGVLDSYSLFIPGQLPPLGDFSHAIVNMVSRAFRIGFQLSTPIVVVTLMMMVALGVLARLMPALQIFFVALPLQLVLGFLLLAVGLPVTMMIFLDSFSEMLTIVLQPR